MNLDQLRAFCLSLPHSTEQMQWQDHLLFKVGGKMFCITTPDDPALPLSIKSASPEFEELVEREGIIPAPYMARNKWIRLDSTRTVASNELRMLLTRSYELVVAKLPKKQQSALKEKPRPAVKQAGAKKKSRATVAKKKKAQASSAAAKARARSKASLP